MRKGYSRFLKLINLLGDLAILNAGFLGSYLYLKLRSYLGYNDHFVFLTILLNLLWLVIVLLLRIYDIERFTRIERILWNMFKALVLHGLTIFAFIAIIHGYYYSRSHLLLSYAICIVGMVFWRLSFYYLIKRYRRKGANFRHVVIIGAGSAGNSMLNYFRSENSSGYRFLGFLDDNPEKCLHRNLIIGKVSDLPTVAKRFKIDEIFCALPLNSSKLIRELAEFSDNNLIRFKIVPDFRGFLSKKVNLEFYSSVPILTIRKEPLENVFNRFVKRSFDILFSLFVIVFLLSWLFPLFVILIKLSSKGPIFFIQKRSGKDNQVFSCYKFRSMKVNHEADSKQATAEDPRVTQIGKFMRKTNLDELPQFFNVLFGNMSVVGPRPHMLKHTQEYSKIVDRFMVRHLVKPGITGWAQVSGLRGQTEDPRKMIRRVKYDVWYIENWSLLLDLQIIFLTVYNMIRGEENAK
ncbi:MAG: undecaprenyl-phosphate glucose phosphotransferase [Sporocytophaga sp.]|nr:undecaprenyl-phosphate glucose phosphotransferase [Sporocytophaga sp.]